jgi:hypothetical protein
MNSQVTNVFANWCDIAKIAKSHAPDAARNFGCRDTVATRSHPISELLVSRISMKAIEVCHYALTET